MLVFSKSSVFNEKLYLWYKHIHLKSSISTKDAINLRVIKFSEVFDCNPFTAKKVIARNDKILALTSDSFDRNVEFCSQHLKLSEVVEFPMIISFNSSLLQHRYFSLVELGCLNITAGSIFKFPQIMKMTLKAARREKLAVNVNNFLDTFMNMLDCENKSEVESRLRKMYKDGSTLRDIKAAMNAEFLGAKLECSLYKTNQMFHKYPPLKSQSIMNTNHLLDVLFEDFKLPLSKILLAPNILSMHHEIAKNFLSDLPTILGIDTVELVSKIPAILRLPVDSVKNIEAILTKFNITYGQLLCCPKIFNFTPTILEQRLESLCNLEDFALLKCYKKFLWLVYYYNNIAPRLVTLKQHHIPSSISMFTVSKPDFDKYLFARQCRTHIKDISYYLANLFECSESDIQQRLKEYPTVINSSLINCSKVVAFLLETGVTTDQLLNGIGVIFYDIDVVKLYFQEIQSQPDCQPFSEWRNHYNLVQLLIYKIEVDTGFRGGCLYGVRGKSDDSEELDLEKESSQSC